MIRTRMSDGLVLGPTVRDRHRRAVELRPLAQADIWVRWKVTTSTTSGWFRRIGSVQKAKAGQNRDVSSRPKAF